ncbi:YdeI/OmpD-associated family protein [Clostridium boliviensis]|uniref:YdeI/OmpD-associated family protein n=1 Tax=Clostridium boliviensis TaxID=318465 RepID=A0ABU4GJ59_9CLOT|nr:YdeI/OmpD-associated family protein [Clostridium boliviensis]MDW2797651.1 YdeI/OmpD-associated family protein [Clostridium boliviensis]
MENLLRLTKREELRSWLLLNSSLEKYCWVVISITPKPETLLYLDVVEEAICFGWIDGIKKKHTNNQLLQRISPRSKKSSWTELNKQRAIRLEKLGLMTEHGRNVLPDLYEKDFIIDEAIENRLRENENTYNNFMSFPELYRKIRLDTIIQVKNNPELFEKRLNKLIINTRNGKMYGAWNDHGRLIDY